MSHTETKDIRDQSKSVKSDNDTSSDDDNDEFDSDDDIAEFDSDEMRMIFSQIMIRILENVVQ